MRTVQDALPIKKALRKCVNFHVCSKSPPCLFYAALTLLLLCGGVVPEFRFCYQGKGPHKIRETACPGGFIAFSPLNVTCMYYAKGPDISDLSVKFTDNMCDPDTQEIDLDLEGKTDLSGFSLLNKIQFEYEDELAEATPGIEVLDETCAIECLADWVNPFQPEDEPMLIEKPPVSDEERVKLEKESVDRTRQLFLALIRDKYLFDDMLDEDPVLTIPDLLKNHTDVVPGFHLIIKLLAKSMRITMVQCAPFIDQVFYEYVLKGMIHFHDSNRAHSLVELDPVDFQVIYHHLEACEKAVNTRFVMNGTRCEKIHTVDTIINLDYDNAGPWKYRRQSRSFRWGVYDPLIEAAWAAVDFVHGFCFETFYVAEDVLYFHLYIQAMEALFPFEPVQKHWMYPVKLRNDEFWNVLLETDDVKNQMRNVDACAIAAYLKRAPYQERLLRPFVLEEQIENPQYEINANSSSGWKTSVSEYWTYYEKQGSFKELSKSFGYCLDGSKEDLEAVEKELEESGLNC